MRRSTNPPLIIPSAFLFNRKVVETTLLVLLAWWYKNHSEPKNTFGKSKVDTLTPEEEELFLLLQTDKELRDRHIAKLQAKTGFAHLSLQQASEIVDTMLRFTALAYDMVRGKDRGSNSLPSSY